MIKPVDAAMQLSFFPGCSLETTAKEAKQSLVESCHLMGVELVKMEDWNCCGSSSAHSLDPELALGLAGRILSLADPGRPLMVMCPSCYKNLRMAQDKLLRHPAQRRALERKFKRSLDPMPPIVSFLELIRFLERIGQISDKPLERPPRDLAGLKVAPYYGCMLAMPPNLQHHRALDGLLEKTLSHIGAEVVYLSQRHRCCGTFLSAARPELAAELVDSVMGEAVRRGAECIVTACAMCQLNLEIRCTISQRIPSMHLTEVLALAYGAADHRKWWTKHLVNPVSLLRSHNIIA